MRDLRHRVKLYRLLSERDASGGSTQSWLLTGEVWAMVNLLEPDQPQDHDQIGERLRARFTIRSPSDIAPGWRLVWQDRWFDVISVLPPVHPDNGIRLTTKEVRP